MSKILSLQQSLLLKRINRCPKGYYLAPKEDLSAQILYAAGLIRIVGITAYPKEEKR